MPVSMKDLGIDRLSVDDRIALAEEIWDSIAAGVEQAPLTEAQRLELDRRLAAYEANPSNVIPWGGGRGPGARKDTAVSLAVQVLYD